MNREIIDKPSPYYEGQYGYRIAAEYLKWITSLWPTPDKELIQNAGIDCSRFTEALLCHGRYETQTKPVKEILVFAQEYGTKVQIIREDEEIDIWTPETEFCFWDYIGICRIHEPQMGYGVKWFTISKEEACTLLKEWAEGQRNENKNLDNSNQFYK